MGTAAPTGAREWEAPGSAGSSWNEASWDLGGISADSGPVGGSGWICQCGMVLLDLFPTKPKEGTAGNAGEERFWWEVWVFLGFAGEKQ